MNLSSPIPWSLVPVGAVVLVGIPRTVQVNVPVPGGRRGVMLEGFPAFWPHENETTQLVTLDDTDATGILFAAGLNPAPIQKET